MERSFCMKKYKTNQYEWKKPLKNVVIRNFDNSKTIVAISIFVSFLTLYLFLWLVCKMYPRQISFEKILLATTNKVSFCTQDFHIGLWFLIFLLYLFSGTIMGQ